jgi:cysteine desulfurase/selenocysteine lyase
MINVTGNLHGLAVMSNVHIIGGAENLAREGLVSFFVDGLPSSEIVAALNENGIRTHVRKSDHYSSNILAPIGQDACVRVPLCHCAIVPF